MEANCPNGHPLPTATPRCMRCAIDASVTTVITLDKSQAGGVHEKAILDADLHRDPVAFNTHVAIGQSATHQISHTKGGVLDGRVGFEGSTNWSASGEGTFVVKGHPGGPGYRAQNNTLAVFTDPDTIARFTAERVAEHLAARGAGPRATAPTSRGRRLSSSGRASVASFDSGRTYPLPCAHHVHTTPEDSRREACGHASRTILPSTLPEARSMSASRASNSGNVFAILGSSFFSARRAKIFGRSSRRGFGSFW
jgi:hypothetical protein